MVKRIQIIREHRVSISDERGSGRICREMLTLANQYFTKTASLWDCILAMTSSANRSEEQKFFSRLTKEQISSSNNLHSTQAGTILSASQIQQNLVAISARFAGYLGALALFVEFLQIQMWVETPLSCTNNLGLKSI